MDTLTLTTVCVLCAGAPTPAGDATTHWQPLIAQAAARFGIPDTWVGSVMKAESGGHTLLNGQLITSRAGAMGLMQIMPDTYATLRQRYGLGADPYAPRDNILAGAAYLKEMYVRYGYPNLFAAYNAGPGRLDGYLIKHIPLPVETLRYVNSIIPSGSLAFVGVEEMTRKLGAVPDGNGIFVALAITPDRPVSQPASSSAADGLFVPLAASPP